MPSYHIYLVSSLPFLQFGTKAPIGFTRFLEVCADLIPKEESAILENCTGIIEVQQKIKVKAKSIIKTWYDFEFMLRDELVKIRAKRLYKDPAHYLRSYLDTEPTLTHRINEIMRQPSPLEVERLLDILRWNKLDGLCLGHYFDIEFLFIYAQKLLILERWDKIRGADKQSLLSNVLETVEHQ